MNTETDNYGRFDLKLTAGELLIIDSPNYERRTVRQERILRRESGVYYITPSSAHYTQVLRSEGPEVIRRVDFENISDYTFLGDTLLVSAELRARSSAKNAGLPSSSLTYIRLGKILTRNIITEDIKSLHSDPNGRVYVLTLDSCYLIENKMEKPFLNSIDKLDFFQFVAPIYGRSELAIYYFRQLPYIPEVVHRLYFKEDGLSYPFRLIRNMDYFEWVSSDFSMLNRAESRRAEELEKETQINKMLFAPFIRSKYLYRDLIPPYAPAFLANEKIILFDHSNNWFFRHALDGSRLDSTEIYHNDFIHGDLKAVVQDGQSRELYCIHDKGGVKYLRHLNSDNGSSGKPFKLYYPFAENISVREGYVYYLHKNVKAGGAYGLLREKLPFN